MTIKDLAITSLETITAFDIHNGDYLFELDELQNATLSQGEEKVDITGKQGRKITSLKRNKTVTVSGTNGLVSAGLIALQTGNEFKNGETEIMWNDYVTVGAGGVAATNYVAFGTAGAEIKALFVKNENDTLGKKLVQGAEVATGVFTYNPETKALAFNEGDVKEGDELVVKYARKIRADYQENISDNYSEKCVLYIDAMAEDKCSKVYHIQICIPKADFSGEFSLEMGDNQTVHAFEAEGLAGSCGKGGALWTYTIFEDDVEDAA